MICLAHQAHCRHFIVRPTGSLLENGLRQGQKLVAVLVAVGTVKWHLSVQVDADIKNKRTRWKPLTDGLLAGPDASLRPWATHSLPEFEVRRSIQLSYGRVV